MSGRSEGISPCTTHGMEAPVKVGQLMRNVAPVDSLVPGSQDFRERATGLKTGPGAGASPKRLPPPLKEPNSGATLSLDQQIHSLLALWPSNSRSTLWLMWGQPRLSPFWGRLWPTLWSHTPAAPGRSPCSGTANEVWRVRSTPVPG